MERKTPRRIVLFAMGTLAGLALAPVVALDAREAVPAGVAASASATTTLGDAWTPIPQDRLDQMRGGFELPSGVLVSFGIERLVHVNGELVASATLNVTGGQVEGDLSAFNRTLLVQVGEGNRFEPTGLGGVVVQNTLDDQDIRISTRIDAQVGTLGVFQAIRHQEALQDALAGAVLP